MEHPATVLDLGSAIRSHPSDFLPAASPATPPTKIALFGVGRWGAHLLRNFLAHPQAQVVAVVDPSLERLECLPQRYNLSQDIVLTSDWQTVFDLPGLEAVVIATPAVTHYSLIQAALQRGLHVLAEKPLTLNEAESLALCQLAADQQCQLVIDHTYLFHPAIQRGRDIVHTHQLGELRYGYAARTHLGPVRQDVDALWDLAIHDIAIFNLWLNESPIEVQAHGTVWLQPQPSLPIEASPSGLSDLVWVKLTYPSGFQAFIHLCWSNPDKQRRLSIVGDRGTLIFDELATTPLTLLQGRLEQQNSQFLPLDQQQQAIAIDAAEPLHQVCTHFLTCVQHNLPSWISPGWLGADLVRVLAALTRSIQQGGLPISCRSHPFS